MVRPLSFIAPIAGVAMLIYAGYCISKGGTHVRGKGWMTKEEAPKSYIVNQVLYMILGFSFVFGEIITGFLQ